MEILMGVGKAGLKSGEKPDILVALLLVGFLLAILLYIFQIVVMILAVIASSKGEVYHYPLSIRFIK